MFRSTSLSPSHYAGKWAIPDESQRIDLAVTNNLANAYGAAPVSAEKEAMLLKLLESFHGYLSKYLVMILRGTIPEAISTAGRESREFLRTLAPRGATPDRELTNSTCKMLHLAFKGCTTEEIYDTLAFCFMRAARKYDPFHTDKVKQVAKEIDGKAEFTAAEQEARVGFDPGGILRALVRRGYMASIIGRKHKVIGYRPATWPPPASFPEAGPIGFAYVVRIWFRFYLNEYITAQMAEIETEDGMMQLCSRTSDAPKLAMGQSPLVSGNLNKYREIVTPHPEGSCTSRNGEMRFMADISVLKMPLDVSTLNIGWVARTISIDASAAVRRGSDVFGTSSSL